MIDNGMTALSVAIILIVGFIPVQLEPDKPLRNKHYLGSEASKAYHFPWLVSIHREQEMCGSGSILTPIYVLASLDSFIRISKVNNKPFFQDVGRLVVYSAGVWAKPYLRENTEGPEWLQARRVKDVWFWSDPDQSKAIPKVIYKNHQPDDLNYLKRSPFGLSMSIALIEVVKHTTPNDATDHWIWKRITLPIPLLANTAQQLQNNLNDEIASLEEHPWSKECNIGGWRLGDGRLVQHQVVYIPLEQCAKIYCSFDYRACYRWPVESVHVCFKSVTFTNLCWHDQGSALFCQRMNDSVVAILTSAPTCGFYGLPAVYTLINHGVSLLEAIAGEGKRYTQIPEAELKRYTPPDENELLLEYR